MEWIDFDDNICLKNFYIIMGINVISKIVMGFVKLRDKYVFKVLEVEIFNWKVYKEKY